MALGLAETAGITRLADLTGLDCLGVRVFQAVRPWGRSLSVHQGKGFTQTSAMIGALMEAIESDRAETYEGDRRLCAFADIDPIERAPMLLDFAHDRRALVDESAPVAWVATRRPGDGRPLWAPFDAVSADYSRPADAWVDRSSNGLGARFDDESAGLKAIVEVIERDADLAWRGASLRIRSQTQVDETSISGDWFQDFLDRARSRGVVVSVHRIPAIIPLMVFVCELFESGAGPVARRRASGTGCGFTAEMALSAAVLEAAQSRLTAISGARDDLPTFDPGAPVGLGLGLPHSEGARLEQWEAIRAAPARPPHATVVGLADALAEAGYPDVGLVDLAPIGQAARVIKAFAPGLGGLSRTRRPPLSRSS